MGPTELHPLTAWEVLRRQIAADGSLTEATLQDLNALFERLLVPALEILDRAWVSRVVSPSGRQVHVVKGKSQGQYVCIGAYCQCQFFAHSVVAGEALLCKHLLAVRLREVLQPPLQPQCVSDQEIVSLLASSASCAPHTNQRRPGDH